MQPQSLRSCSSLLLVRRTGFVDFHAGLGSGRIVSSLAQGLEKGNGAADERVRLRTLRPEAHRSGHRG